MESGHYKPLFPDCEVIGLDYQTFTPWDSGVEIHDAVEELKSKYENVILIANSIGAFFCMNAGIDKLIQKAYFISPVVDMERLNGYELTGEWWNCFTSVICFGRPPYDGAKDYFYMTALIKATLPTPRSLPGRRNESEDS